MIARTFAICLVILLAHVPARYASAEPYGSGWYQEVQLAIGYEDNLSRSYKAVDVTDDAVISAGAGLGYTNKLRDNLQYVVSGYITYNKRDKFDALSHLATSIGGEITYQPDPQFDSIWYTAEARVTRLDYRDSDAREGYLADVGVSINRRIGMSWNGHVGYRYHDLIFDKPDADALRDAAFDVARHEVFIGLDHQLSNNLFLVTEYSFQHGGLTSSTSGTTNPALASRPSTEDAAFETCTVLLCSSFYAYRSVADVHGLDIGIILNRTSVSYDLSARYYDARADGGTRYKDWIVQFGMIWYF